MATKSRDEKSKKTPLFLNIGVLVFGALLIDAVQAQRPQEPGRSIGKVSTEGNLIVVELDEGVLGKANLFDLVGRTLRFTPDAQGCRVENVPLCEVILRRSVVLNASHRINASACTPSALWLYSPHRKTEPSAAGQGFDLASRR